MQRIRMILQGEINVKEIMEDTNLMSQCAQILHQENGCGETDPDGIDLAVYMKKEALWIVGNIAASEHLAHFAVQILHEPYNLKVVLSKLIFSSDVQFIETTLWLISNLLSDDDTFKIVQEMPVIEALCQLIASMKQHTETQLYLLSTVVFCAKNYARFTKDSE